MLKNNILYSTLLTLLGTAFLLIQLFKVNNMDILYRMLYVVLLTLGLACYLYPDNKYIFAVTKIMTMIISRTVKYTLDLLTLIFLFVYFSVKLFNTYYKYELKSITKYIVDVQNLPQFSLSWLFVLLMIITACFWMVDSLNIFSKVFSEVKNDPSIGSFESYSLTLMIVCLICLLISLVGLIHILYDLFFNGLTGSFGL